MPDDFFTTIEQTKAGPWRIVRLIPFPAVAARLGVTEAKLGRMISGRQFPPARDFERRLVFDLPVAEKAIAVVLRYRRAMQRFHGGQQAHAAPQPRRRRQERVT